MQTLQLNADYTPMKVLRWERAVELVLDQKAVTAVPYEGRFVRSASLALPWPAVLALKRYTRENAVTACNPCNTRKADRTPTQASMPLRMFPRVPTHADILRIAIGRLGPLPTEWTEWLPHIGSVGDSGPLAPAKLGAR